MCHFATIDIFALAELTGVVNPRIYSEDEEKALSGGDLLESLREDGFLETVFGTQSRLSSDQWVQKVMKEANYIFNASEMRKKIFNDANVTMKH